MAVPMFKKCWFIVGCVLIALCGVAQSQFISPGERGRNLRVPGKLPTSTIITSTTAGTYYTPYGARWLRVTMYGGASGGVGGNGGGNSTGGGNTTFGTSFLVANGGNGSVQTGGAQPAVSTASGGDLNIPGALGIQGAPYIAAVASGTGGNGAPGPYGGAGQGNYNSTGSGASANTGAGGGGGGAPTAGLGGTGGNSGAFLIKIIVNPSSSYSYAVGTGGAGSAGGSGAGTGGAGAAGAIIIEEHYEP